VGVDPVTGTLFDPTRTTETECPVCGATRLPGANKADGCWVDEKRAQGDYERRPKACLNTWNPDYDDEIPY
jgi:hypothetical protein